MLYPRERGLWRVLTLLEPTWLQSAPLMALCEAVTNRVPIRRNRFTCAQFNKFHFAKAFQLWQQCYKC